MEYVLTKFYSLRDIFVRAPQNPKRKTCTKKQFFFDQAFRILNWDNTAYTLIVFLACNVLFWFVVYNESKPLGLLFKLFLILVICDAYIDSKDLSNYDLKYVSNNFEDFLEDAASGLMELRKENPSFFCIAMSTTFMVMNCLASNFSGYFLAYLNLLSIFFTPLIFNYLPVEYQEWIRNFSNSLRNVKRVLPEEELIPPVSTIDFDSLLATQDSATTSLASSISAMPSFHEDQTDENQRISFTPDQILSSSSDSESDLNFNSSTHPEDSSSSEEEKFSKGLRFRGGSGSGVAAESNLSNFLSQGVANVLRAAAVVASTGVDRKNSSSDSEFEIIDPDEAN